MAESDLDALTKVIYGEARGEVKDGQIAVGYVVMNRAKKLKSTVQREASRPNQFDGYAAASKGMSDATAAKNCREIAQGVLNNSYTDKTLGATHFYSGSKVPYWAKDKTPCYEVGHHKFFNNID